MAMKRWVKPNIKNEWEVRTVFIGKKEIVAGNYKVRWNDGHEEDVKIVMIDYRTTVQDMHLQREVQGTFPNIVIKYHGQKMLIPIDKAGCEFLLL